MRLWHYELIPYLPNKQLVAQWRELNSIFKKQDKHILINYVYDYPKNDLYTYTVMVIVEMQLRGYKIKSYSNYYNYFGVDKTTAIESVEIPFKNHHTFRYLKQCFYNLEEKYDRGQADFSQEQYKALHNFLLKQCFKDIPFKEV